MTLDDILGNFPAYVADAIVVAHRDGPDAPLRTLFVNDAFVELFGWSTEEVLQSGYSLIFTGDPSDEFTSKITEALNGGCRTVTGEAVFRDSVGRRIWCSATVQAVPDGAGRYTIAFIRDITSIKRVERSVEQARADRDRLKDEASKLQARMAAAINSFEHPLAIWDPDYRLVACNDAFSPRMCGRYVPFEAGTSLEEVIRIASRSGQFADAIGNEEAWYEKAVADIKAGPINHVTRYTDGKIFSAVSHHPPNGDTLIVSTDITEIETQRHRLQDYAQEQEALHRAAERQARLDDVTGLGNRRFLTEALERMVAEREVTGGEIAALHIDLDRFKQINDTMGHAAGDRVLKTVGERLRRTVRDGDVVARVGGDEFVVLLAFRKASNVPRDLAGRLCRILSDTVVFDGKECRFGASVGIAQTPLVATTELLTHSDIALYKAKEAGRGWFRQFDQADLDAMHRRKALADDLLRGLEAREFVPFFQPQVDPVSGRLVALEALARWDHPTHGILPPASFLDVAAELCVGADIDAMIFEKAIDDCRRVYAGRSNAPGLTFNAGSERIMSEAMEDARWMAAEYPGTVSLELLETIFMDDAAPDFMARLDRLRDMGFMIEVDDFGSGRASIVALQRIGPDRLKIDRRLIEPITTSKSSLRLVKSIIEIGQTLKIGVTAEGVETAEHVRILADLGCDRMQGFYYSRPAPLATILSNPVRPALSRAV